MGREKLTPTPVLNDVPTFAAHRPRKAIDWEVVDKLLRDGCNGVQVSSRIGVFPTTLYERVQETFGITFTAYMQEKSAIGESLIYEKQMEKALNGDTTMLIFLGKVRNKQKEESHINYQYKGEILDLNENLRKDVQMATQSIPPQSQM